MKCFESFRARRREIYENLFSARPLCIAGLLAMPALLFNPNTLVRALLFLFYWFLSWLSGRKNNPLFTLLVISGIAAFNLIVPYGEVLFSIGAFKITSGALAAGIQRAVTLEGLIMLSRFSIRRDLRIPGLFGELIGESFRIFSEIADRKRRVTGKNFISGIDSLMLELSGEEGKVPAPGSPASRTKAAGFVILALIVILSWLAFVFRSAAAYAVFSVILGRMV